MPGMTKPTVDVFRAFRGQCVTSGYKFYCSPEKRSTLQLRKHFITCLPLLTVLPGAINIKKAPLIGL